MRQLRNIINAIYSVYALMYFFLLALTALIFYAFISWMPEKRRLLWVYRYNWVWLHLWCLGTGIRIRVEGESYRNPDETYIFIANHSNMLDILVTGGGIVHPFRPLLKRELFKIPIMGWVFRVMGLPVDRSSEESRRRSYQQMLNTVSSGISMLIFPEGTRNRTDIPFPIQKLLLSCSLYTILPPNLRPMLMSILMIRGLSTILPIVLTGIQELQPVDTWRLYPGKIGMRYLEPVATAGMTLEDLEGFKSDIYKRMESAILAERKRKSAEISSS